MKKMEYENESNDKTKAFLWIGHSLIKKREENSFFSVVLNLFIKKNEVNNFFLIGFNLYEKKKSQNKEKTVFF